MRMNSQWMRECRFQLADNALQLPGQSPTVGIAKHDDFRATPNGCLECLQCIGGICLIPIEKMLGVIDHALPVGAQVSDRLLDNTQVIFKGCQQNVPHMQCPCFSKDRANGRVRVDQRLDISIIFGPPLDTASGTEGCNERVLPGQIACSFKEFYILRI